MSRLFLAGQGTWKPVTGENTIAIALYSFTASDEHQVSFIVGEPIKLEEEAVNWYRGRVLSSGKRGIFPQSFVCIKNTQDFDIVTNELTQVIREWGTLLISYFKDRKMNEYKIMKDKLSLLIDWHSKILSPSITLDVREMLKSKVISKIEEGRRLMGLDMIVRTPNGEPAHEKNTGIIQLYRMHQELDTLKHNKFAAQPVATSAQTGTQSAVAGSPNLSPMPGSPVIAPMGASPASIPMMSQSLSGSPLSGSASSSPLAAKKSPITQTKTQARKSVTLKREVSLSDASLSGGPPGNNNYQPHQLFLDLKIFMCSVGESAELYFSIYNRSEARFITEEYQVGLTSLGMPHDVDKIGKLSTLFIDLSKKELQSELYLVCRLIRKGKMLYDSTKKAGTVHYRRPFGCSVLKIEDNVSVGKELEHTIPIYTTQESNFSQLHEMIIKNPGNLQAVPKAKGICVGLTLLAGDLKQVVKDNAVLEEVQKTNKLGFPEVIFPGETRNDLFITLESGEYSQDRKTSAKNVEVVVQARMEDGELIKDCLFYGDKPKSEYKSTVFYHSNQPHWNETFRVNIPISILSKVYLVFGIRHCTTSENKERVPFALSYLKLTNSDGTVIGNKVHSIPSYKPNNKTIEDFLPNINDPNNKLQLRKAEQTKVKVLLCSTMCTQNLSLLTLLKWDQYNGDLGEVLNRFTFVDQIEIIKFMQETFNALFSIMEARKVSDPDLVFSAITWIIGLLVDEKTSRYTNFRPVLDIYIENHFKSTVAHIHLIGCLKRILTNNNNFKPLMSTLKSMEYILKFIVTSKKNFDKTNPTQSSQFKEDLTSVFSALSSLMKKTEGQYIGSQTTALKIFSSMFNDLGQLFSLEERSSIAINFVDSVRFEESLKILNMEKMNVILNLAQGDLFLQPTSRVLLMPMVKKHLKQHMMSPSSNIDDIKKYAEIIAVIIENIQSKLKDIDQITDLVELLPEIMKSIQSCFGIPEFHKLDMIHNLYSILYLMEPKHFDKYIKNDLVSWTFLLNLLVLFNQLLSTSTTYPDNWLTLSMFQYNTIKKVIIQTSKYLQEKLSAINNGNNNIVTNNTTTSNVVPSRLKSMNATNATKELSGGWSELDQSLWSSFFSLSTTYFKLKGLALENFSEAKQNTIKTRYGDMRNDLISTVQKMWTILDKYQIKLLVSVISPFLELMLINQNNIKLLGIDLYYQLLRCEFKEYKSFKKVETETINTLDQITNTQEGSCDILDEKFRIFFSTHLEEKMNSSSDAKSLDTQGKIFIKDMTMFLELLYELRTLPDRPEYEDDRTIAAMQLMTYLKQTDRQNTYFKYVHLLCKQHLSHNNFVEAGNTLLLHADSLTWSDDLDESSNSGDLRISKREKKEKLYKQAIEYFDKGKAWEKAIALMKQLIVQYEEVLFDYQKLADILQQESTFYRKVIGVERFFSEYFRVGYYGKGFDTSIQGKEFIYKGYELERMADFVQRIQGKFPSAKLLTYTELPPPEILNSNSQYLQIYAVKPIPAEEQQKKEISDYYSINNFMNNVGGGMNGASSGNTRNFNFSPAVTKFKQNNNINTFLYSKPFKKSKLDKSSAGNEFKDLWIINYYYHIQDTFPTIHRRSEIIKRYDVELAPIDNAVNTIIGKNVELIEMISKYDNSTESNTSPFTMVLKGVIDAAVNGGVNLYKEVFFTPDYLSENPSKKDSIDKLKLALSNQLAILEKGLIIHSKVMSQEMSALQEQLEIRYKKMKTDLDDILNN